MRSKHNLLIAEVSEDDMPRILEIEREAISPEWTHGALLSEVYSEDSFFAAARLPNGGAYNNATGGAYNAANGGAILGFVILKRLGEDGELLRIAVDPAARRCGIADFLMGSALGFAGERELRSVFLEVRKSNDAAISLYKKHGFSPVRVRKDYFSDPVEDAVIMSRGNAEGS